MAMNRAMSAPKHSNRKLRTPSRRTQIGASSGPTITPANDAPAFNPFSVASLPRDSSSSDISGEPWPMLNPNTVTEAIAAARLHCRSRAADGRGAVPVLCIASPCRYRWSNANARCSLAPIHHRMRWLAEPPLGLRDRAPFALIVAITACGTLGMHLIIPALPATAHALHVSPGAIQLTITLYLIGLAIGQLVYGPISDRLGRRPVLIGGLALFTFAGILTTAAPGACTLVIARVLQSIGACAGLVLGRAIVRDSAAPDRAAAQLAMLTMVMSMAPAIAPVLGGYATAWFGWRAAFALLAIVGAVTLLLAVLLLPETYRAQSGARASLMLGSLRLFRSRAFCGYVLGGAFTTTSFYAFMAASPFILVDLLHQSTERVGLYYLLLMAGVAVGQLFGKSRRRADQGAGRAAAGQFVRHRRRGVVHAGGSDRMADRCIGDRAGGAVHGRRRHGQPIRAERRGQRQSARDRVCFGVVRLHPDGVWRVLHCGGGGVASGIGVHRCRGVAGIGVGGPGCVVVRRADDAAGVGGRPAARQWLAAMAGGVAWAWLGVEDAERDRCFRYTVRSKIAGYGVPGRSRLLDDR